DGDVDRIGADVTHDGAAVTAAAAVLDFAEVSAARCVGVKMRGRIRAARLDQHLAGRSIVVTLADFDRVCAASTATAARGAAGGLGRVGHEGEGQDCEDGEHASHKG